MASEREPFIPLKLEDEKDSRESLAIENKKSRRPTWRLTLAIHMFLIAIYSVITVSVLMASRKSCQSIYTNGPIGNLRIHYKTTFFTDLVDSPYMKKPSLNTDVAWDNLLEKMHIRVTAPELAHHNQSSVALTEGGGYLAWLEVFHELHCINMLRQWIYRDYYHPNLTDGEFSHWSSHADHCLDMLRQASMCHADTSLTTFVWDRTKVKPMFNVHMAPRTCVDFDQLVESTQYRWVDVQEIEELQNPLMGNTFST